MYVLVDSGELSPIYKKDWIFLIIFEFLSVRYYVNIDDDRNDDFT